MHHLHVVTVEDLSSADNGRLYPFVHVIVCYTAATVQLSTLAPLKPHLLASDGNQFSLGPD